MALNALRNSILSNELKANVIYNEKKLAETLGISRTPVREALLELSAKNLIRFLPQKGVMLNTFSAQDIEDVFEIRTELEFFAIKKICLTAQEVDLLVAGKCIELQRAAVTAADAVAFMEADKDFHLSFSKLANNNYLMETMRDIRDIIHVMGFRALRNSGRMEQVIKEHQSILAAVEIGDAQLAMDLMDNHLIISREAVHNIKQEGDYHA